MLYLIRGDCWAQYQIAGTMAAGAFIIHHSLMCKDSDWQNIQIINHLPTPLEQHELVSFAAITNNSENLRYNYKGFFCDLE